MKRKNNKKQITLVLWLMLIFVISGCGKQDTTDNTETITEETTEPAQKTNDEETVDTESIAMAEALEKEYKAAYHKVIQEHRVEINQYDWQYGYDFSSNTQTPAEPLTPISLVDITGDSIPELIYMAVEESYSASLHICTYQEGAVKELFAETWDVNAGGGTHYILFQIEGSSDLYTYLDIGDDWWQSTYSQYGYDASGNYTALRTLEELVTPNDDYSDMIYEYTDTGNEITKEAYQSETQSLLDSMSTIILYNQQFDDTFNALIYSKGCISMTYSEADALLGEGIEEDTSSILAGIPTFIFSSGAGAWSTGLTLYEDGTFEGSYSDSDMGDTGDGYPHGTIYLSGFTGAFTDIKKVNAYTYSMQLANIELAKEPGTEWIEDEIRYIASEPHGMQDAGEFLLYLPGAPTAELPQEFIEWIALPRAWGENDIPAVLEGYGLYNVNGQMGFYAE